MSNRILIVDNDEAILDMMKEALAEERYSVKTSTTSRGIFDLIQEFAPSLVLIDYILDDINGGEICHQIKSNPATSHIPVIIFSGHSRVLKSLGTYGSDAIIEKPFNLQDLLQTIDLYVSKDLA
jgi:DNA-binding response OmpR family regulator